MNIEPLPLDPYLQRQVDNEINGLDIMHGHLKVLLLEAEKQLSMAIETEEENDYDDAMESMERTYWEGQVEALTTCYMLTYHLSFAIADKKAKDEARG